VAGVHTRSGPGPALGIGASAAAGCTIRVLSREVESALEGAPRDAGFAQQVADVFTGELNLVAGGGGAHVANRISIANERIVAISVEYFVTVALSISGFARCRWFGPRSD
jgi:hypothetical protein